MANWTAHDTNTSTGDDPAVFAATVKANAEKNRNHFIDSAAPASPVEGMLWFDDNDATRFVCKLYQNGAWVVLTDKIAEGNRDFDGKQALTFLIERLATGSLPAASAANEARLAWDSTREQGVEVGSAQRWYQGRWRTDGTAEKRIPCDLQVTNLGTPATASTATDMGGWLLDAAGEELNIIPLSAVPYGYTGAHDLYLDVACLLGVAETANDDIDMTGNYISMTPGTDGTGLAETTIAAVASDIGSSAAQYALHSVRLTLDWDLPASNVAAGDYIRATITRNGLTNIAGIIVVGATLAVPCYESEDSQT